MQATRNGITANSVGGADGLRVMMAVWCGKLYSDYGQGCFAFAVHAIPLLTIHHHPIESFRSHLPRAFVLSVMRKYTDRVYYCDCITPS